MTTLILRRILLVIPTLLVVSFAVMFFSLFMNPDPAEAQLQSPTTTQEQIDSLRHELGIDRPVVVRWGEWVSHAARLDFGTSFRGTLDVRQQIMRRFPVSLSIALIALILGLLVGVPVGIIGGSRPGRLGDRLGVGGTVLGISVPNFVIGMLLAMYFGLRLDWLPAQWDTVPFGDSPWGWLRQRLLPASALAFGVAAAIARQLRGALIDTLGSNYVRTAWAMGAHRRGVIGKHALKNASIPAVTAVGLQLSVLIAATVLVENVFSVPGLGSFLVNAVRDQDLPIILGVTSVFVLMQLLISLFLDIAYGLLNPKVRVS